MFCLLKYNLTFCFNYDFQIVSLLFSVKVKNELCNTSAHQLCLHGMHRDNFTFYLFFYCFPFYIFIFAFVGISAKYVEYVDVSYTVFLN
jgi:hypothetical protein